MGYTVTYSAFFHLISADVRNADLGILRETTFRSSDGKVELLYRYAQYVDLKLKMLLQSYKKILTIAARTG
jgi:hypothetical protein